MEKHFTISFLTTLILYISFLVINNKSVNMKYNHYWFGIQIKLQVCIKLVEPKIARNI